MCLVPLIEIPISYNLWGTFEQETTTQTNKQALRNIKVAITFASTNLNQ